MTLGTWYKVRRDDGFESRYTLYLSSSSDLVGIAPPLPQRRHHKQLFATPQKHLPCPLAFTLNLGWMLLIRLITDSFKILILLFESPHSLTKYLNGLSFKWPSSRLCTLLDPADSEAKASHSRCKTLPCCLISAAPALPFRSVWGFVAFWAPLWYKRKKKKKKVYILLHLLSRCIFKSLYSASVVFEIGRLFFTIYYFEAYAPWHVSHTIFSFVVCRRLKSMNYKIC